MTIQANSIWKYLRRSLTADPGRFAGGSAVSDPLGLLAVERERLIALQWPPHDADHPAADTGSTPRNPDGSLSATRSRSPSTSTSSP
ncbi:MAG: hypothetical protein ACRDPD_09910 [Streptosporangiaceae bacterium]